MQVVFRGAGGSVVSLTQDTIACGVGTAASVGSGHFYVTADVVCGAAGGCGPWLSGFESDCCGCLTSSP